MRRQDLLACVNAVCEPRAGAMCPLLRAQRHCARRVRRVAGAPREKLFVSVVALLVIVVVVVVVSISIECGLDRPTSLVIVIVLIWTAGGGLLLLGCHCSITICTPNHPRTLPQSNTPWAAQWGCSRSRRIE